MRIIISPAKKMNVDTDSLAWRDLPQFLDNAQELLDTLRGMDEAALQTLWNCSDKLASLNIERLREMDLRRNLTPAILSYEGIQYQYMAPNVFTSAQLDYVQEHLRILSGFYGVLRPFDGVTPYRLEMQARLKTCKAKDLYSYWNKTIYNTISTETDCVVNLASKEYSLCVSKYIEPSVRFVTCVFGEEKNGKIVEKGTMCKMARGEMVRFMAVNAVEKVEQLKEFRALGYAFDVSRSDDTTYVFVKESA